MRAVIFDLDGTLLNTAEDIRAAVNYGRRAFEGRPLTKDEMLPLVGSGLLNALKRSVISYGPTLRSDEELNLMYQLLMGYYRNHPYDYAELYEGVEDLLLSLKGDGVKLALLSNKEHSIIEKIVANKFSFVDFDYVAGSSKTLPMKPDRRIVEIIASELGAKVNELVIVGDSEVDYKTAENSNIPALIVSYGFRSREELEKSVKGTILDRVPKKEDIYALFD